MDALIHRISAWDGLQLAVREWDGGDAATPILCLPGLIRTGEDFAELAQALGAGRRVVALDYAGRGASGRSRNVARYAPEACLRDVLDICAALHLHQVAVIGTSFGGLLAMGLAAARPTLLRAVVLNDIGPDIGTAGAGLVRWFVANDPALPDLDACAAFLRAHLPPLSLRTEAAWRRMAALTYQQGADGRFHPRWDMAIARLLDAPPPPLWALFGALSHVPLQLVWGEASDILSAATIARMRDERPDLAVASLPGVGHAPVLTEPPVLRALAAFLGRVA
jgi:pimeloyl-ACP methyl ester carboxylesterase